MFNNVMLRCFLWNLLELTIVLLFIAMVKHYVGNISLLSVQKNNLLTGRPSSLFKRYVDQP